MCIRDSTSTVSNAANAAMEEMMAETEGLHLTPIMDQGDYIKPVSYTHLDVYKRQDYGNELTFGADYGAYTDCDATGLAKPGDKVVDVLTWAFYRSFQEAINEGNSSLLRYSTADNSTLCAAEIRNYTGNTYDLGNFQAVSDPASIKYTDGQVIYNGHFVANYTDSGSSYTADHHRTLRLVWEDGIWKVDAFSLLPDGAYSSTTYAPLP